MPTPMDDLHFLADAALADATPSSSDAHASLQAGQRITLPPLASIMPSPPPTAQTASVPELDSTSTRHAQPRVTGWSPETADAPAHRQRVGVNRSASTRSKRDYPFAEYQPHSAFRPSSRAATAFEPQHPSQSATYSPFPQHPHPTQASDPRRQAHSAEPHPLDRLRLDKTYPERSVMAWHDQAQRLLDPPRPSFAASSRAQSFSYPPSFHSSPRPPPGLANGPPQGQVTLPQRHRKRSSASLQKSNAPPSSHDWTLSEGPPPLLTPSLSLQMPQHAFAQHSQPYPTSDPAPRDREYTFISHSVESMRDLPQKRKSISDDSISALRGRATDRKLVVDGRRSMSHADTTWGRVAEQGQSRTRQNVLPPFHPILTRPPMSAQSSTSHHTLAQNPSPSPAPLDMDVVMGDEENAGLGSISLNTSPSASYSGSLTLSSQEGSEEEESSREPSRERGTTIRLRIPPCPPSSINSGLSSPKSSSRAHSASTSISSSSSSLRVKAEPDADRAWSPSTSRSGPTRPDRKRSRQRLRGAISGAGLGRSASSRQLRERRVVKHVKEKDTSEDELEDEIEVAENGSTSGRKNGPRRRMQNAVAQKRFRLKKKEMAAQMAADLESAEAMNEELKTQLAEKDALLEKLQGQVGQLKRKLSSRGGASGSGAGTGTGATTGR